MAKLTKSEVDYSVGMMESHCGKVFKDDRGYCNNYIPADTHTDLGHCIKVTGNINPVYWCKKFAKAK